jgi:hypothetical protein
VRDAMVSVARVTHTNWLFNRAVNRMPQSLQRYAVRRAIRDELVPSETLYEKYLDALRLLTADTPADQLGDYLEFGVYQGTSMSCMIRAMDELGITGPRFIGFDSFEGMPADTRGQDMDVWSPGDFTASLRYARTYLTEKGADWNRTFLVKGWFEETLTPRTAEELALSKASVIMIDCDIYSSAKVALNFCRPYIRDRAIVFFDDWNAGGLADAHLGERKAFDEFLAENPQFSAEPLPDLRQVEDSMVFAVSVASAG